MPLESDETAAEASDGTGAPTELSSSATQYATVEEMRRIEAAISGRLEQEFQNFRALLSERREPASASTVTELTDAQIDEAINEGRLTYSQGARLIAERATTKLRKEHVDPLQTTGLAALGNLTKQAALPLMPHYAKYKKEIDQMIEALPANSRLTPETYKMVHDAVVGAHIQELLDETREAAVRSAGAPKPESGGPQTRTGRANAPSQVPTVEELLGADAAAAMESKGQTPDQFAKRLGYKDWSAYAEVATKQLQGVA